MAQRTLDGVAESAAWPIVAASLPGEASGRIDERGESAV